MPISQVRSNPRSWSMRSRYAESSTMSRWLERKIYLPCLLKYSGQPNVVPLVHRHIERRTTGFIKRTWKSCDDFTPLNSSRSSPLRTLFGSHGVKPFITRLNCLSLSSSSNTTGISSGSYGRISSKEWISNPSPLSPPEGEEVYVFDLLSSIILWLVFLSQAKCDWQFIIYGNRFITHFSWSPAWHFFHNPTCLLIKCRIR